MKELSRALSAERQASQEIGKNDKTKTDVERLHDRASREERRHDNERDRDEIEDKQPVAELVRTYALSFVEFVQRPQTIREFIDMLPERRPARAV